MRKQQNGQINNWMIHGLHTQLVNFLLHPSTGQS